MLLMLLIDHFGGFNTLLACLFDGGVGICVEDERLKSYVGLLQPLARNCCRQLQRFWDC